MYRVWERAVQSLVYHEHLAGRKKGEYLGCGRRYNNRAIIEFCFARIWRRGFNNGWKSGEQSYKQLGYENPGIKV